MTENKGFTTAAYILAALIVVVGVVLLLALKPEPCPSLTCPECKPVVVNSTVEVSVPVDYQELVADALMAEVSSDKSFRYCDKDLYDLSEITLKKVYDGFQVTENSDGELSVAGVEIKLNYDDGDCYQTFNCGLNTEQELECE